MNKANECTCPSGDGSLVHPCPAHPAVEQAGGDERAAFELFVRKHCGMPAHIAVNWDAKFTNDAWAGWQARAALAQPSPVRSSLLINGYQLRAALDFIAPDGTAEQLESEACIEWRQQDADFLEAGLYAFCAEYPEEGSVLLDEEPTTAQPSPLQSEQAEGAHVPDEVFAGLFAEWWEEEGQYCRAGGGDYERTFAFQAWRHLYPLLLQYRAALAQPSPAPAEAERPEVVARVVHSNPVVLGQCGPLNANDELMTVAQHAASVARWAEMFNRVEQQRDAALARVEQQERTIGSMNEAHAKLAGLYEAAQAQHSVPELLEWAVDRWHAEVSLRPLINVHRRALDDTWRQVIRHLGGDTGLLCGPSHDELLAAAPGNSVPQAWLDVQAERRRQVEAEGWTPEHDDLYCAAELPRAAAAYILNGANDEAPAIWPFVVKWWKPRDARSNYVRAGALILAEIERLDRAAPGKEGV